MSAKKDGRRRTAQMAAAKKRGRPGREASFRIGFKPQPAEALRYDPVYYPDLRLADRPPKELTFSALAPQVAAHGAKVLHEKAPGIIPQLAMSRYLLSKAAPLTRAIPIAHKAYSLSKAASGPMEEPPPGMVSESRSSFVGRTILTDIQRDPVSYLMLLTMGAL